MPLSPSEEACRVTAEQYATWSDELCSGVEIVDGRVVERRSASKRHNRLARLLANALDAASGPGWHADTDFDVRLQDVPLNNRRHSDPSRAHPHGGRSRLSWFGDHGPDRQDRSVREAGIQFYWRVKQAATGAPLVRTYVLDPASGHYRDGELFTGIVKATASKSMRAHFTVTASVVETTEPVLELPA